MRFLDLRFEREIGEYRDDASDFLQVRIVAVIRAPLARFGKLKGDVSWKCLALCRLGCRGF